MTVSEFLREVRRLVVAMEQEQYRRLLPGYIRRFVGSAGPSEPAAT
jgi:hypothetical protein